MQPRSGLRRLVVGIAAVALVAVLSYEIVRHQPTPVATASEDPPPEDRTPTSPEKGDDKSSHVKELVEAGNKAWPTFLLPVMKVNPLLNKDEVAEALDYIMKHPDCSSYHLLLAIQKDYADEYKKLSNDNRAAILCGTLAATRWYDDWCSLENICDKDWYTKTFPSIRMLLETDRTALKYLASILDDNTKASLSGMGSSEEGMICEWHEYRRKDYAYRFIMLILGEKPDFKGKAVDRDKDIEALKERLKKDLAEQQETKNKSDSPTFQAALSMVVLGIGALAIENHIVEGLWNGERFYRWRPYSYWKSKVMEWGITIGEPEHMCGSERPKKLLIFWLPAPPWWVRCIDYVNRSLGFKGWGEATDPLACGDPRALPMLEEMLHDSEPNVRAFAACWLENQPEITDSATRKLQELRHDEAEMVRIAAETTLETRQKKESEAVGSASRNSRGCQSPRWSCLPR